MARKDAQKRREQRARREMAAAELLRKEQEMRSLVAKAQSIRNVFDGFQPFSRFAREELEVSITSCFAADLTRAELSFVFDLTKKNMEQLYVQAYGVWRDGEKRRELCEDAARYLLMRVPDGAGERAGESARDCAAEASGSELLEESRDVKGRLVGFVHFRFDIEHDYAVLYLYELQLLPELRGAGVGRQVMLFLELLARRLQMRKLVLTCLTCNEAAISFYTKKLGYVVDEFSQEDDAADSMRQGYIVLSKTFPAPAALQ